MIFTLLSLSVYVYGFFIIIIIKLNADHLKSVVGGVTDASKLSGGLSVGAERYILVRNDPGTFIILKKGASGIVGNKTNQCKYLKKF
jgi:hypothetical protein